jgi:hypothetical protein
MIKDRTNQIVHRPPYDSSIEYMDTDIEKFFEKMQKVIENAGELDNL